MVQIRVATVADAEGVRGIYAPYVEQSVTTFHTVVPSLTEIREQIRAGLLVYPWYVAESDEGQVMGFAYASEHHARQAYRWSVNVSIYLHANCHGQGTGRLLYEQLLATLRRQGFRMVHAGITLPNHPSQKIHESFGFQYVGTFRAAGFKLGVWKDVGWWVLDLKENLADDTAIPEPIPFATLTGSQSV